MSVKFAIASLIFYSVVSQAAAQSCGDNCTTYDCIEDKVHCGENGYPEGYGKKYCEKFTEPEYYDNFDENGKDFINCTLPCLATFLDDYVENGTDTDCTDIKNAAFGSHVDCYLQCGFCTACKTNKIALLKVYEIQDFLSYQALKSVVEVVAHCHLGLDCLLPW